MFQTILIIAASLIVNSVSFAEVSDISTFECQPAETTDMNRFELQGQLILQNESSFQGLIAIKTINSGTEETSEEILSHTVLGKVSFFPAGTLYIQDTWLLQGSYKLGDKDLKLSLLIDARNFTSSTVEVNNRVYYAQCLRTL